MHPNGRAVGTGYVMYMWTLHFPLSLLYPTSSLFFFTLVRHYFSSLLFFFLSSFFFFFFFIIIVLITIEGGLFWVHVNIFQLLYVIALLCKVVDSFWIYR